MASDRPGFVTPKADWRLVNMRFNSHPIALFRTEADPRLIEGWTDNPRVALVIKRWRNRNHMSVDAVPDDDEMLDLMLEDDERDRSNRTFDIQELGEDVKRNGVREPIIVTWQGKLLDGNRRKFAVKWALSERGGPKSEHHQLLRSIPVLVLDQGASEADEKAILIQENYAESLKVRWPEVVTNGALYERYEELSHQFPNDDDLAIRRRLREEFPRFKITDIRSRIETWRLIEEFRADYGDDADEDDLDALINDRFQFFRQANDTFRNKNVFVDPEFRDLLFRGINHGLFPSFTSVRDLDDIHQSPKATEVFLEGEGLSRAQKRQNFDRVRDEAGRERANKNLSFNARVEETIGFLDSITSKQLAEMPADLIDRLETALQRIIAQASSS